MYPAAITVPAIAPFYLLAGGTHYVVQLQHIESGLCGDNLMRFGTPRVFERLFVEASSQTNHQNMFSLLRGHNVLHGTLSIAVERGSSCRLRSTYAAWCG